jgi:hypothetical protein
MNDVYTNYNLLEFAENATVISGHPKAGTTLFLSLLDGHRELTVFPEELWYFHKAYAKKDRKKALLSYTGLRHILTKGVESNNDSRKYDNVDIDRFFRLFDEAFDKSDSIRDEMLSPIIAWHQALNEKCLAPQRWVEKGPLNEFYAPQYRKLFPKGLIFFHILRDPRDNWAAYKKNNQAYRPLNLHFVGACQPRLVLEMHVI